MKKETKRYWELGIVRLDPPPLLPPHPASALCNFLKQISEKKPGEGALCIDCDAELHANTDRRDWLVSVALPRFPRHDDKALVSGICPTCAARPDIEDVVMERLRHGFFGGDFRMVESGRTLLSKG
jgi:hypothetical protein